MRLRGLTGAELARRANRSAATVSQALNGHRIHPATLSAIARVLNDVEPLPGLESLIERDDTVTGDEE